MGHRSNFFESLESRQLLSASAGITASLSKGALKVVGTSNGESIHVAYLNGYFKVQRPLKNGDMKTIFAAKPAQVKSVWVSAGAGNDYVDLRGVYGRFCFVDAGKGNGRVYGSDQTDDIYGKDGNDEIHAFDGNDLLDGGAGNDTLMGQHGDDYIVAGPGIDKLMGGTGDDELFAKDGSIRDYITGGPGRDSCSADRDMAYEDEFRWETGVQTLIGDIESIS